ncbi:hypothetical protein Rhe02_44860 [Rhizocola hellebori]|uniref:Uncharacterized protein n=1 Tax=Rhizocola hellebori TaxID=1392758 RepID=A0A8J3Q999_9ACTN|nr:hypothetical protein Rhe02_44860 [Rhizocola hellebori]
MAKASIAALMLAVFVALAIVVCRALLRGGRQHAWRTAILASASGAFTLLALASLVTVMANVQGAVAPFASLLPMLTDGAADPELAETLDQVRQGLADPSAGRQSHSALQVMVSDFSRFHVALAVSAAVVALIVVGLSVMLWRRFAASRPTDRRTRRVFAAFGTFAALLVLALTIVAVANMTTAAQPTSALLAFFNGHW